MPGTLSVSDGMQVKVSSRRGSITVKTLVSKRPAKGVVFIPFHFKEAAANVLTSSTSLDPTAKIPSIQGLGGADREGVRTFHRGTVAKAGESRIY